MKVSGFSDPAALTADKEHKLSSTYTLWYMKRDARGSKDRKINVPDDYEKAIQQVASFNTVEQFWRMYSKLVRFDDLHCFADFHMFRDGIKPMWEDPANKQGGKIVVRLRKGLAAHYWETVLLALIGEQFEAAHEICGAIISVRYNDDVLSLWVRNSQPSIDTINSIKNSLRQVLNLPPFAKVEYKPHDKSASHDSRRTSFRSGPKQGGGYGGHDGGRGGWRSRSQYTNDMDGSNGGGFQTGAGQSGGMRGGVGDGTSSRGQPWSSGNGGFNQSGQYHGGHAPSAFGNNIASPRGGRGGNHGGFNRAPQGNNSNSSRSRW